MPALDKPPTREGPGATPTIGSPTAMGGVSAVARARAVAMATPVTASTTPAVPYALRCSPSTSTASSRGDAAVRRADGAYQANRAAVFQRPVKGEVAEQSE